MRIDDTGRTPGRGAYLCRDAACWDAAARKRALEHALGVALPPGVAAVIAAGPGTTDAGTPNTNEPRVG